MIKKIIARKIFYVFLILNIVGLLYLHFTESDILNLNAIKDFLSGMNLFLALFIYIIILTIRGLTIFPWTPFLIIWILVFPKAYVVFSIEIAIILYTFLIYKYSGILDLKIPKKIKKYEEKIKKYELTSIFLLCFVPWISINGLAYFFSILRIDLHKTLLWLISWTLITTSIYVYIVSSAFDLIL